MDVTDTFAETLVPLAGSPAGLATVHQGELEPVVPLPLVFRYNQLDGAPENLATAPPGGEVAGVFVPPVVLVVPRRNNGPIVALDIAAGSAISVQYTGFSGTRELETFRRFNVARNLSDFVAALQLFDFGSQNWAYADIYGQIAYFTSGELPLREDLEAGTVAGLPPWFIREAERRERGVERGLDHLPAPGGEEGGRDAVEDLVSRRRQALPLGISVDGGFGAVDASGHSARADSANEFRFGSGPVRRYVGQPGPGPGSIDAVTALPGGESGDLGSPFYVNLLPLWLTNDGYPVVQRFGEVQRDALERTVFRP